MASDFGTELDAALNVHLQAVRDAAEAAKAAVESGVSGLSARADENAGPAAEHDPFFETSPEPEPEHPGSYGPAVDFDLDEGTGEFDPSLDGEGIPGPEEISGN